MNRTYTRRKKKFKLFDLNRYALRKNTTYYKSRYRNSVIAKKKFSLYYGNLLKKYLKKIVKVSVKKSKQNKSINKKFIFIELLEQRLDSILYRSHFALSMRTARQMITHKNIKVNNKLITDSSYILKKGDIITTTEKTKNFIEWNVSNSHMWPLPPKYLQINYKTLQIVYWGDIKENNLSPNYTFWLNFDLIIKNYT